MTNRTRIGWVNCIVLEARTKESLEAAYQTHIAKDRPDRIITRVVTTQGVNRHFPQKEGFLVYRKLLFYKKNEGYELENKK